MTPLLGDTREGSFSDVTPTDDVMTESRVLLARVEAVGRSGWGSECEKNFVGSGGSGKRYLWWEEENSGSRP